MRFTVRHHNIHATDFLLLVNEENGEYAQIIPSIGATVHRLGFLTDGSIHDILYCDQDEEIATNPSFRGRILFPFNDIIPGGVYTFNNQTHRLTMNLPMENIAIHGMVYNRKFNLTEEESDDTHCSAQLVIKIKPDTFEGYPFAVELSLTYTLREHSFRIDFHLKNTGNTTAPFSLGWHPYFTFAQSLRDVFLKMESEKHVEVDEKLIPTRRLPPCKNSPFDFSAGKEIGAVNLDNGFTVPSDGTTTLYNKKSTLVIHQGTDLFKYIQLYIPVDHKSIAIEPITAPTNSFNFHELGLRILHPGEEVKSFVTVRVA